MDAHSFVHLLSYLEPVFCAFVLTALIRSGSLRKFPSLAALLERQARVFAGLYRLCESDR